MFDHDLTNMAHMYCRGLTGSGLKYGTSDLEVQTLPLQGQIGAVCEFKPEDRQVFTINEFMPTVMSSERKCVRKENCIYYGRNRNFGLLSYDEYDSRKEFPILRNFLLHHVIGRDSKLNTQQVQIHGVSSVDSVIKLVIIPCGNSIHCHHVKAY
ncbi:hypothetical protein AVEN_32774-1 [Araneus ventricosus]|uniref:Uncharacterized protein n=1 Tax=Araneus ventricosus TaxID=182803 RepID=A0A4Y2X1E8_ARAVE|nr:hypothetical protein AVEN_32774-1 [Araneus ventricosus]